MTIFHNLQCPIKWFLLFVCIFFTTLPGGLPAAEPPEYLLANENAQSHAANPAGWVVSNLKTITAPGDGNTWRLADSKVLVRAFTDPQYYNLTTKKFQNLYPGALWVSAGNELPAWYRDAANNVNAGNVAMKTAQLLGLPTSSLAQYNAVVELWVNPDKLMRPTRDPNRTAQPTALSNQDFSAKPAYMSAADFDKFKTWYTNNIAASYGNADPDKRYPWTQLGYTYNWGGDQGSLASIDGLSEFVILGTRAGVTSPLETFAVYSIQSYLYRTGTDGDGIGNFHVTGSCDTIWAGTKFQPGGNSILISRGGIISGGEGIYISSSGYTIINNGLISGPTSLKYYGDGPAGTSVYFYDGGTLINSSSGIISGDDVAIGGRAASASGISVTNAGYISGSLYAMNTGAGNDSLTVESGGIVRGSVDLGTGTDHILFKNGSLYRPVINRLSGSASMLKASDVTIQSGAALEPELSGTGLMQSGSTYRIAQGTAVTGSFGSVIDHYPVFDFSLVSTGTDLSLAVTRIPYANIASAADPKLTAFAGILDRGVAGASGDMVTLLSEIDRQTDTASVTNAVRQLSPIMYLPTAHAAFTTDRMRFSQILTYNSVHQDTSKTTGSIPVAYASAPVMNDAVPDKYRSGSELWDGFVLASGYWVTQNTRDNVPGYNFDAWTTLAGIRKRFTGGSTAGFSLSGSQANITSDDTGKSKTRIDSLSSIISAGTVLDSFRIDILSAYSYNQYHSDRRIVFGTINRTAGSDHNGHQFSGMMNLGYSMRVGEKTTLEPVAGFYTSYLIEEGFAEKGAEAANLTVDPRRTWAFRSHMGPKLRQGFNYADMNLSIEIAALWLHDFNTTGEVTSRLSSLGDGASIQGVTGDSDAAEMRAGISLQKADSLSLSMEYVLTISPYSREGSVQFGFKYMF